MPEKTFDIETSLTTDYRSSAWGIERIVLDSISNHLPADSKGTTAAVRIKQNDKWLDLKEARAGLIRPAEEIVFEDDGEGYDANLFSVLFSTKADDALSVGQFGEGMKLATAAALRNGLNVQYCSKNWTAVPYAKKENIGGHSISRLCFKITENEDNITGSKTVFTNPSLELMWEIAELPKKVLAFNDTYRELYNEKDSIQQKETDQTIEDSIDEVMLTKLECSKNISHKSTPSDMPAKQEYNSRIIDIDLGADANGTHRFTALFIKGVRVKILYSLFSYDLGLDSISPDRQVVEHNCLLDKIKELLMNCSSAEVIEKVLTEANQHSAEFFGEFEAFRDRRKIAKGGFITAQEEVVKGIHDNLWMRTFQKLYGYNAVLASSDVNVNKDAELMGYKPIILNAPIANYLKSLGLQSADKITAGQQYKWVNLDELTEAETRILNTVQDINKAVLGEQMPVDVRVFSHISMKSGREVDVWKTGVQISQFDGTEYIGIRRTELSDLEHFAQTYIHELGHQVTKADDYSRKFVDFFTEALARLTIYFINREK